jgi:hypothetical protein
MVVLLLVVDVLFLIDALNQNVLRPSILAGFEPCQAFLGGAARLEPFRAQVCFRLPEKQTGKIFCH